MEDIRQIQNRFTELAERSEKQNIWTESDFLSMAEQDILLSMHYSVQVNLTGGYENAERRIAVFGSEEDIGYSYTSPIQCICIKPAIQKFADQLTHRDILGALMSLGFDRKATGDILITENIGYLFCLENIADYIIRNLTSVRHTTVRVSRCEPPETFSAPPKSISINVASERLDALIAAVYKLGRTAAKELITSERVYINSRLSSNAGVSVPENSIISVRGYGRFRYEGMLKTTRKGRLSVQVSVY